MSRYKFLLVLLIIGFINLNAETKDEVKFVIDAPSAVVKGGRVNIVYILNGGQGSDLAIPNTIKGFDILYGPSTSRQSSFVFDNGKTSSQTIESYTYTLLAKEEGTFTIPAATIVVNGRNYSSNTTTIKVLPPDKNSNQQGGSPNQQPEMFSPQSTADDIKEDDVFVRAIFSKTKVNEQEAVVVTFRLYSSVNIRQFVSTKFPEFEGFMTEEFEFPVNRQISEENYRGRNYFTLDVKKTLLFPQRSGKITIPSGTVTLVLTVPSGQKVMTFTGPKMLMADVEKTLRIAPVSVNVDKLPDGKPLGFSGGVGTFKLNSSISSQKIKANEAITLKLEISGTGNLKLIKNPELKLSKDFEMYDPKITNDFSLTGNGLSGRRTIDYLFIPRVPGKFTVPELEFSYFDTSSRTYKTLKTESYELEIEKDPNAGNIQGATSYISQQEVIVDNDIRYLKTGNIKYKKSGDYFTGSWFNILCYIIPLLVFLGTLIAYRKQIKANADIARMKTRKANKVASKRLKQAKKYLDNHQKDKYYEESLRAVWGYLSDKLTIPVANLNRENVEIELKAYGVNEDLIAKFIYILDTCEFARYAPSDSNKAMGSLYHEMVAAIGKMENLIKIK